MKTPFAIILRYFFLYSSLILFSILIDYFLHQINLAWIGRYFGFSGTILIITSLLYSARKRKKIKSGGLKGYLRYHEYASWVGSLMILVHAGVHVNALLPWLAVIAMLVTVASGLTGKYLQTKSISLLKAQRGELSQQGYSAEEIDRAVFLDSLTVDIIKKWRKIHYPITLVFAMLALAHIVIVFMYMARF